MIPSYVLKVFHLAEGFQISRNSPTPPSSFINTSMCYILFSESPGLMFFQSDVKRITFWLKNTELPWDVWDLNAAFVVIYHYY